MSHAILFTEELNRTQRLAY